MIDGVVDEQLLAAVMAASRALVALTATSLSGAPIEVTLIQHRALAVLAECEPRTMAELAGVVGVSASSCTRLVERLERKGLVRRSPCPDNRRQIHLHLEADGRDLVASVTQRRRDELETILSALPPSRVAAVRKAFREVAELAGETVAAVASPRGSAKPA